MKFEKTQFKLMKLNLLERREFQCKLEDEQRTVKITFLVKFTEDDNKIKALIFKIKTYICNMFC